MAKSAKANYKAPTYSTYTKPSGKSKSNGKSSPFGEFIFGIILICLALPMVWMNERRQVKIYKVINAAEEQVVKNVNNEEASEEKTLALVHTQGCTQVEQFLTDERFGIEMQSMKLRRNIEMF